MSLRARVASILSTALIALGLFTAAASAAPLPRPAHVIVVIEENKSLGDILDNPAAPYLNRLMREGANFVDAHGVMHPSLPNYFALFAGLVNNNGDGCPATGLSFDAPNLGAALIAAHLSFAGYAESLPEPGFIGCSAGRYARKHAPWVPFTNVPRTTSLPFSMFPDYPSLPTVAFVIPNLDNDMHDGPIAQGDAWLVKNIAPLVAWGRTHDTLLIVTWDEGFDLHNHIPTIFAGPMVKAGRYAEHVTPFRILRTLEDMYGLPHVGRTGAEAPIDDCWLAG